MEKWKKRVTDPREGVATLMWRGPLAGTMNSYPTRVCVAVPSRLDTRVTVEGNDVFELTAHLQSPKLSEPLAKKGVVFPFFPTGRAPRLRGFCMKSVKIWKICEKSFQKCIFYHFFHQNYIKTKFPWDAKFYGQCWIFLFTFTIFLFQIDIFLFQINHFLFHLSKNCSKPAQFWCLTL